MPYPTTAYQKDLSGPYNEIYNDPEPSASFLENLWSCYLNEFNYQPVTMNLNDYQVIKQDFCSTVKECDPLLEWPITIPQGLMPPARPYVCGTEFMEIQVSAANGIKYFLTLGCGLLANLM